jgi:hypothetical protein
MCSTSTNGAAQHGAPRDEERPLFPCRLLQVRIGVHGPANNVGVRRRGLGGNHIELSRANVCRSNDRGAVQRTFAGRYRATDTPQMVTWFSTVAYRSRCPALLR